METWLSALEIADLVRRKEVKPLEVLDAILARLEAVNPTLNAFCLVTADVARVAAREAGARSWREEPVMNFKDARVTDIWLGRLVPSRHNTSAPDMMFNDFRAEPPPRP
jgi:Asp-tRNA(Asn)/Glu-tRNA(Gln) amidotransferase A subunit family amidase